MSVGFRNLLSGGAAAVTLAGCAYCVISIWAGLRFRRAKPTRSLSHPPVSFLKPLKGTDPGMYDALRSHCLLEYPEYEILLGVTDPNDPAITVAQNLMEEFPQSRIRLVHCTERLGVNGKVSSLAQLASLAQYEFLVVNDSDIRVSRGYLRDIVAELEVPGTGLVTCLYRGLPSATLASRLEALGISTDFAPGILVAREIERGLGFGLGSTLALRRSDLASIGGFESIADYLADDYEIGRRIRERGLRVTLSRTVVDTFIPAYDFSQFVLHQLRWARTIRSSRPGGYAGLIMTHVLPWAVATLVMAGARNWSWYLLGVAILARTAMAITTANFVLDDANAIDSLWLLPLRDFVALIIWVIGCVGRRVVWRGETFALEQGRLVKIVTPGKA
jgi:ceramide glucosyltransferase